MIKILEHIKTDIYQVIKFQAYKYSLEDIKY
jgi:hypothetical protein